MSISKLWRRNLLCYFKWLLGWWRDGRSFLFFPVRPPWWTAEVGHQLYHMTALRVPTDRRWDFNGMAIYIMWNLWKERNHRIFDNIHSTAQHVAERTKECLEQFKRARFVIPVWAILLSWDCACVLHLELLSRPHGRSVLPLFSFCPCTVNSFSLNWKAEFLPSSFKN